MKNKNLGIGELISAFYKAGMYISPSWIRRQEDKGNLIVPRSTTNFKRAHGTRTPGAVRVFTPEQIDEILIAFLPKGTKLENGEVATGKGYYNYQAS